MKPGEVIESRMLSGRIEKAQRKVESHNFDIRKQLLLFDDVANDQRKVIYQQRTEIMGATDLTTAIGGIRGDALGTLLDTHLPRNVPHDDWDLDGLTDAIEKDFATRVEPKAWLAAEPELDEQAFRQRIVDAVDAQYAQKAQRYGPDLMKHVEKDVMLRTLDQHWREHLGAMDYLRQGIHLRGYAQKDYRYEYKREAYELFSSMLDRVKYDTASVLTRLEIRTEEDLQREEEERAQRMMRALQAQHAEAASVLGAAGLAAGQDGQAVLTGETAPSGAPAPVRPLRPVGAGVPAGGPFAAGAASRAFDREASTADGAAPFVRGERKVGRNEPCPCGSGRKFKHCHGALEGAA
jgi:preprotein translocase subunit SecA